MKTQLLLMAICSFIIGTGSFAVAQDATPTNSGLESKQTPKNYKEIIATFNPLSAADFNHMEQDFFVYFGRETCPYCRDFAPKLFAAATQAGAKIYVIDTENTGTDPQLKALRNSLEIETVPAFIKIELAQDKQIAHFYDLNSDLDKFIKENNID